MFAISKMMALICLVAALNCATIGYDASMMSSLNILVCAPSLCLLHANPLHEVRVPDAI